MKRKLLAVPVALGALVVCLIVPSMAMAVNDPDLTQPTGTLLAAGTQLKGTNNGNLKITAGGQNVLYECAQASMTVTLKKNNGSEIEADIGSFALAGTGASGECTHTIPPDTFWTFEHAINGLPWCLRSTPAMKDDEVQMRGGACSAAARPTRLVQFTPLTDEKGTIIECVFEKATPIVGTYTTHSTGEAILAFSEVEWTKVSGGIFCGSAYKFDFSLTMERDEATAIPVYIS